MPNNSKSFIREVFVVYLLRVLLAIIIFATDVVISRYFGPEIKGMYYILLLIPAIISVFITLGLDYSINIIGHKKPELLLIVYAKAVFIAFISNGLLLFSLFFDFFGFFSFIYKDYSSLPVIISYSSFAIAVFLSVFNLTGMLNVTSGLPLTYSLMRIIYRSIVLMLVIFIINILSATTEVYLLYLLLVQITAIAIAIVYGLYGNMGEKKFILFHRDLEVSYKEVLVNGLSSYWGKVAEVLQSRFTPIIVAAVLTFKDVGHLSVAIGISELNIFIATSISSVLLSKKFSDKHLSIIKPMVVISLLTSVSIAFLGYFLINIVYGYQFNDSRVLLLYLIPSTFSLSIILISIPYILQTGLANKFSNIRICLLFFNVVVIYILTDSFGVSGAALGISLGNILMLYIVSLIISKNEGKKIRDIFLPRRKDISYLYESTYGIVSKVRK